MSIVLYRIDDRLIHGQVVVGWGQPLDIGFFVLVDDEVACSDWEQELYRMGVPPGTDVYFHDVASAVRMLPHYRSDPRRGILLTADIDTMRRLVEAGQGPEGAVGGEPAIKNVNVGGLHHREGRFQRLRYVFLSPAEEAALRALSADGIAVSAQDVPGARPIPLAELLAQAAS